jgi:alpha-mannosidase
MSLPEWIRVRLAEVSHWQVLAESPVSEWEVREAKYHGPGQYEEVVSWRPLREGDIWGYPDGTFFLRTRLRVGKEFSGMPVTFELVTPTEMLFRINGELANALDPNRSEIPLLKRARGGERFAIDIEAYMRSAPDDQRIGSRIPEGHGCVQTWRNPRLVAYDPLFREFMFDLGLVLDVAACKDIEREICDQMYFHVDAALKLLDRDTHERKTFQASLQRAKKYLQEKVYSQKGLRAPGKLALVGHSHIDVAYHWSVRQGVRKNARTTAVQLALMDEYPEFIYTHTQPYLYEQLKLHYPELWIKLKAKVKNGQWEPVGGMYVEPDCNTPSGESFVRQCLLGKLFFLNELGLDVDTCWLPDVFGNSWILPQILMRSGIRYFVSNKMSTWNDTNKFPHNNFLWKGVDGSVVDACVPASHFISWLAPDQLLANWDGFQEKLTVGESMNMYGFGDGGGGVTREILETARRIKDFPGLPATRVVSAKTYLADAFANREALDVWDDELYLEMHRGTLTTKAILKKLNRRCELVAREAEIFGVLAQDYGYRVERPALTEAWKQVLVNQFHDILPGSHTTPVGDEAVRTYSAALDQFEQLRAGALASIAAQASTEAQDGEPVLVFNSLNWQRTGLVKLSLDEKTLAAGVRIVNAAGEAQPVQVISENGGAQLLWQATVPSVGYATYYLQPAAGKAMAALKATPSLLENIFFRIKLTADGEIASLFDKRLQREAIAEGEAGNHFDLYEDKPGIYDAWDILPNYKDNPLPIGKASRLVVVENGPVRAGVRFEKRFFDSVLTQTIWIYRDVARVDFETHVSWHEHNKLLKVCFPVSVLARRATYDLSYGSITRPTHTNTSWDKAKFEVTGHQWADLSEAGFGVSLLNDCKYGHDISEHRMRLTLLRGPIRPDPDSDQGEHHFTYSIYPHADSWQQGGTVPMAYDLNCPLLAMKVERHAGKLPSEHAFLKIEPPGVFLGALKPAEDGKGAIVRLAELMGGRGSVHVQLAKKTAAVQETDLLERPERTLKSERGGFSDEIRPFQLKSYRVK